jgi:hypothetical protein
MNRFEQLIEYVINDEEAKARELFHEIVVEKSREIYENLMQEEAKDSEEDKDLDEAADDEVEESAEELDEAADDEVEESAMGGDAAKGLIDDVEMDEESDINTMEGEDEEAEVTDVEDSDADMDDADMDDADMDDADMGGDEPATKDDIMNLEDKLDELMAEFEDLMGHEEAEHDDMGNGDDMPADIGGDAIATDDTAEMEPMAEAISLKQVKPKVTTSEEGDGKSGPVAFNSGKTGMAGKPVHVTGDSPEGKHDTPAYKNTTKDLISDVQNQPGKDMKGQKPATKPHLAQATGVNTKSPLPGRRG